MTHLTLVPAGAGAGKTHHIKETLADWVVGGEVSASRILAVTFTEAAASEMRDRIRGALMARRRIGDALEIDRAYIGTIHALGQRLLTEHAFAGGRSPESRLLTDPERDLLIRLEMGRCEALKPLMTGLARFGYAWDPQTGMSAEEKFRAKLLQTVDLIRGLGERGSSPDILISALAELTEGYGECEADGSALTDALRRAVQSLLDAFPHNLASQFQGNVSAVKDFSGNHKDLRRALEPGALERDWKLWQKLRNLRQSKRGSQTPEGYDERAAAVVAAADCLPRHPGPLEDACAHLTAIVSGAQEVLSAYQTAKRVAGLIDYADMIVETEALLGRDPAILQSVIGEIDCVVIDEFQDTNPVQFALLWRLACSSKHALIVGDTKQSIMGFQGADARLSAALQTANPDIIAPLDRNWRSDPRIMELVNTLGPTLFPDNYDALSPVRAETGETAFEALNLPRSDFVKAAPCIANRVAELLANATNVFDKVREELRSVRPEDIAVLCYTHGHASSVAAALEAHGIPVRIQQTGWLNAPAMCAARAALAYASDPNDKYAALTWLTLGPPRVALEDALRNAVDGVLYTHQSLETLRGLNQAIETLPIADAVALVLQSTGLRDWATCMPDATQALADLARLDGEAQEFDRMFPGLRAAAGFHGCNMQIFLGWISGQTERDWDRHPNPDSWSGNGVEICTWHSAKGREWPITIVAGLDQKIAERPGTLRAEFESFDDLSRVLDNAGLGFLPDFAAPESQQLFDAPRHPEDMKDATRKLYVALTRARDRLILALPKERRAARVLPERMVDILRDHGGLAVNEAGISLCGRTFQAQIIDGKTDAPETPSVAEHTARPAFGERRALRSADRTAWRQSPSTFEGVDEVAVGELTTLDLGAPVTDSKVVDPAARGTAWHLAFRVLVQFPDKADQLQAATGLSEKTLEEITVQAKALTAWLDDQGYSRLHFELPLQRVVEDGSETNAIIDLLAEGPNGLLIVDHKSGACPDPEARFATYRPQLRAYADLIRKEWPEKQLNGIAINWMSEGTVSVLPIVESVSA
ncbi:UvrD-helicase domain-containing protein [Ruegeria atlantica]|uniref:UvrD-helicase domain-containing protein n=1 Tax=Ruegeria atlantica TaxID=81569 RepID=UPI0014819B46|nr:UvrD-helicase domain-containing protein [Ruegeria atlantica]